VGISIVTCAGFPVRVNKVFRLVFGPAEPDAAAVSACPSLNGRPAKGPLDPLADQLTGVVVDNWAQDHFPRTVIRGVIPLPRPKQHSLRALDRER
jgi:hypothetical protein